MSGEKRLDVANITVGKLKGRALSDALAKKLNEEPKAETLPKTHKQAKKR